MIRRLSEIIRDLELDHGDLVIFGSGPLLAHRLRDKVGDLDVIARGETWNRVSERGNRAKGTINGARLVEFCGGRIQFSRGWISDDYDADELIDRAEVFPIDQRKAHRELRFARLDEVLRYKKTLKRSKDRSDIRALARKLDRPQEGRQAHV
ncbi:hypothetical protein OWR29_45940 [Actinoplanes sp. Pm04-4]|uniref:Uncharacterized protein n=1 Tax=Paractinoplanes pyxinae TaxID=2997416 RepID=A0ABT4BHT0_9ACTN|nr:hypothetical protein [Actinoplanes pyxinae]MCY1145390.1 hypothetical protein [Actinoplanes pyxinae]